ncbi:MAG TPA: hypothetical protein VEK57_04420 [Thermoanaerobaculia bacterium]|nr:hypothetical protein [Thermoanaerobaculia bacterium]
MILYYAVGGGLGHLTRGRRVLESLGLAHDAAIVTASPHARHARVAGGIPVIEVPAHLEHAVEEHRAWIRGLAAERLLVDTFPGGIQGELCGLDLDLPMDLVARLLRWDEYRRAVPGPLPSFGTTWLVEELGPSHDAFVRRNSRNVVPLDLSVAGAPPDADGPDTPYWLIVHSGPEDEVRELIAYTSELRALAAGAPERILVATRCSIPLPEGFERIDACPATSLFPRAERIISAAGFNIMLETEPWRNKHEVVPFARRFDDQYRRAARRREKC